MKTIKIGEKEYDIEFSFAAADEKGLVQKMFKVVSGAYMFGGDKAMKSKEDAMIDGTAEMISDLPQICKQAFYAGLQEHNSDIRYEDSVILMQTYMKENKLSFNAMYQLLKTQMEEDGFFNLTGITEILTGMTKSK